MNFNHSLMVLYSLNRVYFIILPPIKFNHALHDDVI